VGLVVALIIGAVLVTACGSRGDDHAKVEASLRSYFSTLDPKACLDSAYCDQGVFPLGAGFPQVRKDSCKKIHTPGRPLPPPGNPRGLSAWSCVITFAHGKSALPVAVGVRGSSEVYSAVPVSQAAPLPPATVYEGGP